MCWYLCSASSTVYPAKRCTRCRSENLSASRVAVTFDRQEPFPYGPTHGLALEFHLGLYFFCNFAHKALQWQQTPGSQQQEADRVTEHAERYTQLKPMSSGLPLALCRKCKTCCNGDCPQAISGGLPNQRESLVLFLHLSSSLGQPSVGRETRYVSGATLEAAAIECGTEHIDERCDGLAGLTVDDALQCSLEMKKTHEYFSSSRGACALDIKAPYRRRASCDHSDKAGFDDAFRETHSKMQPKNAHRLEAGRPRRLACRARSQKLLTTGSCELCTSGLPQGWRQVEKKYHVSLCRRTSGSTATSIYGHPRLKQYQRP